MAASWTEAALAIGRTEAAPLRPSSSEEWRALAGRFADPGAHDLAIGLGQAPSPERLLELVSGTGELALWRLGPGPVGHVPILTYSLHTTVPRLAALGLEPDDPRWGQAIGAMCRALFAHEHDARLATLHLPVDSEEAQETALYALGFSPFAVDPSYKPPVVRQIFGLRREVHERFAAR